MEEKIVIVLNEMSEYLSITQMKKLQEVIIKTFADNEVSKVEISNEEFLEMFLDAKRIEGCSERTIIYYQATVKHLLSQITTEVRKITRILPVVIIRKRLLKQYVAVSMKRIGEKRCLLWRQVQERQER